MVDLKKPTKKLYFCIR